MTMIVAYENQTVALTDGKIFSYENRELGKELNELPKGQFKKVIGKKGL